MQNNVNQDELNKFIAIAERWWDLDGPFKPLHQINPVRLSFILQHSNGVFAKRVLDVGCGGGILAESLARHGAQVEGLDMAEESLQVARLHAKQAKLDIRYDCQSAENHAAQHQNAYPVVTCLEMLEHVPEPFAVIQACANMTEPGGDVFFSTLNRNIKSWLLAIVMAEYVLDLVPAGTHEHQRFITPAEMCAMITQAGLEICHMQGLHLNPLTGEYFLDKKNVDVNYIIHCRKPV